MAKGEHNTNKIEKNKSCEQKTKERKSTKKRKMEKKKAELIITKWKAHQKKQRQPSLEVVE